jgi:hypothetical protein
METLKLNFNAEVLGKGKSINIEVPYANGIVATSRFCPIDLLSGDVELLAAINGESLEDFVADCKLQLKFAADTSEDSCLPNSFIAGLIAAVLEHESREGTLTTKDYLLHLDVFSYLVYAAGVPSEQVCEMYPRLLKAITEETTTHKMNHQKCQQ